MSLKMLSLFSPSYEKQYLSLDYSDPLHMEYIFHSLGGKNFVTENHPIIAKAIENTKNLHANEKPKDINPIVNGFRINNFSTSYLTLAPSNSRKHSESCPTLQFNFYTNSAPFGYRHPYVLLNAGIIDLDEEIVVSTAVHNLKQYSWLHNAKLQYKLDCPLQKSDDKHFIGYALWNCLVEKNGISVMQSELRLTNTMRLIYGIDNIVKNFDINPINPAKGESNPIKIAFGRKDDTIDKYYGVSLNPGSDSQHYSFDFQFPLSGKLTLEQNYYPRATISHPDWLYQAPKMTIAVPCLGEHSYDVSNKYAIYTKDGDHTVNFNYNERNWNWKCNVVNSGSDYSMWHNSILMSEFALNISYELTPGHPKGEFIWHFNINTEKDGTHYHSNTTTVNLPNIQILWGCFKKDTLLRTSEGKDVPIDKLKEGDLLLTDKGETLAVQSIITGMERELLVIETVEGHKLEVSMTHPVATAGRDLVKARDLRIGEEVLLAEGKTSQIKFIYPVEYNDTVYNLKTGEKPARLIANGFIAGDYAAQNAVESTPKLPLPPISAEMQEAIDNMEKLAHFLART